MNPSTLRQPSRLGSPAADAKARTTLDRLTATPVPAGWRVRAKGPTFNSAV